MKRNILKYILFVWLAVVQTLAVEAQENQVRDVRDNEFASFVEAVQDLKRTSLKRKEVIIAKACYDTLPDGRRKRIPPKRKYYVPQDAVREYIRIFDRLRCTIPEAVIQCYYLDSRLGAQPFLVASPLSVDSLARTGQLTLQWCKENAASAAMQPADESPMAYFQYLYFKVYGEQFALYWHALYNKRNILLDYPSGMKKETWDKNMLPVVTMNNDACIITLYEDTHEAISQVTYSILRQSPYTIERINEKVILAKPSITY